MDRAWWPVVARVVRFAVLVAAGILLAYLGAHEAGVHWSGMWLAIPH